ncbi:biofilm regulation diguanylate cyclase SiaD [Chitinimonas sp. BJYL2]|uniref:biofilm regulation diguanylate cyclase SiaD n=1 Tax=Chitinimonas sp. BJYL2 TaxID=2976696 RepID=UPI0022B45C75|nr:biofilm regulation diguanylate cyclase SiaD [Chitinimonas sp. BJYL2]
MSTDKWILEEQVKRLLADPDYQDNPLRFPLSQLWHQHHELLNRLDRITRVSDVYQSMAREREQSMAERVDKQLRQLQKVARISDRYQQMMQDLNAALKEASTHDALTGLPNRRLLMERLRAEVERDERHQRSFCIALLDFDHFKLVNDRYGHDAGDAVLIEAGRCMQDEMRDYDLCGRWGGEEFLILLPETTMEIAVSIIERVRMAIAALKIRVGEEAISITVSSGLAAHRPGEAYADTLNRADAALLEAKRAGRNQGHSA